MSGVQKCLLPGPTIECSECKAEVIFRTRLSVYTVPPVIAFIASLNVYGFSNPITWLTLILVSVGHAIQSLKEPFNLVNIGYENRVRERDNES